MTPSQSKPSHAFPYALLNVRQTKTGTEYLWCGDCDLIAITPDFIARVGLDVLPWKLEYVRDERHHRLFRKADDA